MSTPLAIIAAHSASEADTASVAVALAACLEPGDLVALEGPLGAGKTVLVRALCEALEVPRDAGVRSPTYALVHHYEGGRLPVAHLDLYRLADSDELEGIGYRDLLAGDRLILVEWADRVTEVHADADVVIRLEDAGPTARRVHIEVADAELARDLLRLISTSIECRWVQEPSQPRADPSGSSPPESSPPTRPR